MLNWKINKEDAKVIREIAARAHAMNPEYQLMDCEMDITATHLNGNPLKLAELASAAQFDFAHDVFGIARKLDRSTGQLTDCFSPRYSA